MNRVFNLLFFSFVLIDSPQFTISTIAGTGMLGRSGDNGAAVDAQVSTIGGMTIDINGNVFLADTYNCAIRYIYKVTGIITTIAGNGTCGSSGDGFAATSATLRHPDGLSLDTMNNNLYIADTGNNKIRLVSSAGIITTFAGNGAFGSSGDGGAAINAQLHTPYGVAIDKINKNVYIADSGNGVARMVNSGGIITTIAGMMTFPIAVALDQGGNLYIADAGGNNIRKVTMNIGGNIITTVAGSPSGTHGYSGDGDAATSALLYQPTGVAVDNVGNIYIADYLNNVVRRVAYDTGIITTVAGGGMMGSSLGDGGSATSVYLASPNAVAVDMSDTFYIADSGNHRIRKVVPGTFNFPTGQPTEQPTERPSAQPTSLPTEKPTSQPSRRPTSQPSQMPMPRPTGNPSVQPSSQPSQRPVAQPSHQPIARPSRQPSSLPTEKPSRQPLSRPSGQPSHVPQSNPTGQPTAQPTRQPSRFPPFYSWGRNVVVQCLYLYPCTQK